MVAQDLPNPPHHRRRHRREYGRLTQRSRELPKKCNKYVLQKDEVYCYDMMQAAGITLDQLYAWNPALNGNSSGLYLGYAYCIGVSS